MTAWSRPTIASAVLLSLLSLSACVADAEPPVAVPSPSETPLFATEEEALAAAVEAYSAYLAMSDLITEEGGNEPDRISPLVTGEQLVVELEGFRYFREKLIRTEGRSIFSNPVLQASASSSDGTEVTIYVCLDASGIQVVDAVGNVVAAAQPPTTAQIQLQSDESRSRLVIGGTQIWADSSVCS